MVEYILNTDGCCLKNRTGGTGAYLQILLESENNIVKYYRGYLKPTTNNRMELRAGIEGLKLLREKRKEFGYGPMTWYTDSKYVADNIFNFQKWRKNNTWQTQNKEPVLNRNLWKDLEAVRNSLKIIPCWIPEKENKEADNLSRLGADSPGYTDFGYNPGRVGTSIGNSREVSEYFTETDPNLKVKIFLVGGESRDGRCKIRFQIIANNGEAGIKKYYVYASTNISIKLHRTYKFIIDVKEGHIQSIIEALV